VACGVDGVGKNTTSKWRSRWYAEARRDGVRLAGCLSVRWQMEGQELAGDLELSDPTKLLEDKGRRQCRLGELVQLKDSLCLASLAAEMHCRKQNSMGQESAK
jgi:hypothetical protein